jgi:hypothetical protein
VKAKSLCGGWAAWAVSCRSSHSASMYLRRSRHRHSRTSLAGTTKTDNTGSSHSVRPHWDRNALELEHKDLSNSLANRSRNAKISTRSSELSSISINVIHLMLARRNNAAILPLQHTFQQGQTFADVDSLMDIMKNLSSAICRTTNMIFPSIRLNKKKRGYNSPTSTYLPHAPASDKSRSNS